MIIQASVLWFFFPVLTHQEKQPREHPARRIQCSLGRRSWCHYLTFSNALFLTCVFSAGKKKKKRAGVESCDTALPMAKSTFIMPVCFHLQGGRSTFHRFIILVQMVKTLPAICKTWVWSPGEGNGNLLQYSCLENPMDRRAWRARVHGSPRVGHDSNNLAYSTRVHLENNVGETMLGKV